MKLNGNEQRLYEKLRDAEACIPSGYDMEIEHISDENGNIGWYVYRYSSTAECAFPCDERPDPIITDGEAKKLRVNVQKVLDIYGCYYVA